jgi:hypothetical protein
MKKLVHLSIFFLIITTFYGCPVGIDYPLGKPGKEKINKDLLGTWVNSEEDPEVKKASIKKKDDYSYDVLVLERGSMYSLESDKLTGWITEVEGKTFLYLKEEGQTQYYHYMLPVIDKKSMTTCDVSLLDGGVDSVKSSETLRKQVVNSMKKAEFCTETIIWTKE